MSPKHQSRLFAALAAIAFALVAVVAAPRPAMAADASANNIASNADLLAVLKAATSNDVFKLNDDQSAVQLQQAVTITKASGFTGSDNFVLYLASDVTLDLNGKTLTMGTNSNEPSNNLVMIVCGPGQLTIKDSDGNNGTLTSAKANTLQIGRSGVAGKVFLDNGIISATSKSSTAVFVAEGEFSMDEGATVTSDAAQSPSLQVGLVGEGNVGKLAMGGGTITNTAGCSAINAVQGSAELSGGNVKNSGKSSTGGYAVISVGDTEENEQVSVTLSGANVTNGATYQSATPSAVSVFSGSVTMSGGTLKGGGDNNGKKPSYAAVQVGSTNNDPRGSFEMTSGTVEGSGGSVQDSGNDAYYDNAKGGGFFVNGYGDLNISGGNIYGNRAVDLNGSLDPEYDGQATINISGGTFVAAKDQACFYLPSTASYTDTVNITGGTITGGAGIVNLGSTVTVGGNATVNSTGTGDSSISSGDSSIKFPAAGIVNVDAKSGYESPTKTTVTGGATVNDGIVNGVASDNNSNINGNPELNITGGTVNAASNGNAIENNSGKTSITSGAVNGNITNGSTETGDTYTSETVPELSITGGSVGTDKTPANVVNNVGTANLDGGTVTGTVTNGDTGTTYGEGKPAPSTNLGGATVGAANSTDDTVINNAGTTTMTSGTVNGNVQTDGGTANLDGGTVTGTVTNGKQNGSYTDETAPTTNVNGATIGKENNTGTAVTNNAGTTNLNSGTVNGNVNNANSSKGSLNVGQQGSSNGPTINGKATGAGTTVNSGTVTGGVTGGAVSAPSTPTPGAGTTVDNYVQGAVGPVQDAASGYAEVTVSNDLKTWTVDVTDAGETTPLATVANDVVAQVISAIQRGGSGKVTSGSLSLDLPASQADIQAFALEVLQAAIGIPTQATDGPVASDLIGRTVTVTATTNTGSITYTFAFTGEGAPVTVYRLWNKLNGAHLFTSDQNEYNVLTAEHPNEWIGEGARFTEPAQGTEPVYRLYNPNNGDHFFTKSEAEADTLETIGWRIESSNWYSGGDVEVMRFYNPSQTANEGLGNHLWTAEAPEIAALPSMGYVAEGLGWNALSVLQVEAD